MPSYLIERFVPGGETEPRERLLEAQHLGIRYVRSILVPADELCLSLVEAPSAELVREAADRAQVPLARISEAIELAVVAQGPKEDLEIQGGSS